MLRLTLSYSFSVIICVTLIAIYNSLYIQDDKKCLEDVIIHCDGSHFTLLQLTNTTELPKWDSVTNSYEYVSHRGNLSALLSAAKSSGFLVNEIDAIQLSDLYSLHSVLRRILEASANSPQNNF